MSQRLQSISFLIVAGALLVPGLAVAQDLLPARAGDLTVERLAVPLGLKAGAVPRESVSLSWPIAADRQLDGRPAPFVAVSKEYRLETTAAELAAGVPIFTTAPGAMVRLNPVSGAKAVALLDPMALTVIAPTGESFADGTGMELRAGVDELKAAGAPFVEGTIAFRLRADLGAGRFSLRAGELGDARFLVHVLDAASDTILSLRSLSADHLHGQKLELETVFEAAGAPLAAELEGFVTSPAGRAWPVSFVAEADGRYRASLELDALEPPAPGLWEAHVRAHGTAGDLQVLRSARVAFDVAVPSARFDGEVAVGRKDGLKVKLGVEVAAASRYEVRGVLYGSDADGTLRPLAVAHSASWLDAGHGSLALTFDAGTVDASGLGAPFEIRDLRLVDQGRMGSLHRQARALVIE